MNSKELATFLVNKGVMSEADANADDSAVSTGLHGQQFLQLHDDGARAFFGEKADLVLKLLKNMREKKVNGSEGSEIKKTEGEETMPEPVDPKTWSVVQVGEWLRSHNFSEQVVEVLKKEEICGEALLLLLDTVDQLALSMGAKLKLKAKIRGESSYQFENGKSKTILEIEKYEDDSRNRKV